MLGGFKDWEDRALVEQPFTVHIGSWAGKPQEYQELRNVWLSFLHSKSLGPCGPQEHVTAPWFKTVLSKTKHTESTIAGFNQNVSSRIISPCCSHFKHKKERWETVDVSTRGHYTAPLLCRDPCLEGAGLAGGGAGACLYWAAGPHTRMLLSSEAETRIWKQGDSEQNYKIMVNKTQYFRLRLDDSDCSLITLWVFSDCSDYSLTLKDEDLEL